MVGIFSNFVERLRDLFRRKPTPTLPPTPSSTPQTDLLFMAVNTERSRRRLPPYHRDARLDSAAQSWADQMARSGVLDHGDWSVRILASGYPARTDSENIAEGQDTGAECVASWMASKKGHRENVLGGYRDVGVGAAVDRFGRHWWVADFASQ